MENQGAVYTFARSPGGFDLRGKMVAREAWIGDRAGQSVAMSGTSAIVGAHLRARPGEPGGAACIFDASTCITCRADLTGDGILRWAAGNRRPTPPRLATTIAGPSPSSLW